MTASGVAAAQRPIVHGAANGDDGVPGERHEDPKSKMSCTASCALSAVRFMPCSPGGAIGHAGAGRVAFRHALCKPVGPVIGRFVRTERQAREGGNPRTGERIAIGPSSGVWFKAGKG